MRRKKLRVVTDTDEVAALGLTEVPSARTEPPYTGLRLVSDPDDNDNPDDAA
jgi:hypothetical protein